jgi:hypothetical protein
MVYISQINLISIFAIFNVFLQINPSENPKPIYNLTDSDFESLVKSGRSSDWFLIFHLETCGHCKSAKDSLINLNNEEELPNKLNLGLIECSSNVWTCIRFNITRVPYMIYIQNEKIFEFNTYPSKSNLLKFFTEERTIDSALPLPQPLGYINLLTKIFEEAIDMIGGYLEHYAKENLGWNITWTATHTIIFLVSLLFLMIFIEYIVIMKCCRRRGRIVKQKKPEELTKSENPRENPEEQKSKSEETKPKTD